MRDSACCTCCCTLGMPGGCCCQPDRPLPSYSSPTANRVIERSGCSARDRVDQPLRFLLLAGRAFLQHFAEDAARTVRIAHVHVGACQVELRAHLAYGDGFQVRRGGIAIDLMRRRIDALRALVLAFPGLLEAADVQVETEVGVGKSLPLAGLPPGVEIEVEYR